MKPGPKPKLRVVEKQAAPAVPRWVPAIAADAYEAAHAELVRLGMVTPGNLLLLEQYVSAVASARRAERSIARQGSFFRPKGQPPRAHPGFAVLAESQKAIRMLGGRLGLIAETARDARRAGAGEALEVDDDEDFGDV